MPEKLSMHQEFIQKLNTILDLNLENEKFGVSELATEIGLSRSQLHRKLQDINGKSTSQFIREYRLEKAMKMLKANQATASEIAYRVGFTSPTYFNTSFHNFYGYPPGEVKYQRSIAPPKKNYSKKLVGFIPVIILVGLIVFNKAFNKDDVAEGSIEKTIAVLPFVNDSNNEENIYFCNGIMAGIRDHLAKIPEFYVTSRLSVEPYRNTSAPLKVIAKELDVNYVIEGHVQRIGGRAIISAELINVNNNKVLWSERYDEDVSEIFAVQANVIESITSNLETIISPELKTELILKPTQDKIAYDHYLKGEEYRFNANTELQKKEIWLGLINKAQLSYELAAESDSLFAQSYLGLANVVFAKKSFYGLLDNTYLDKDFMALINKATRLNPNLVNAYSLKANYYYNILNQKDKARMQLEKALDLDSNDTFTLSILMRIYAENNNYVEAVSLLKKMEKLAWTKEDKLQVYRSYYNYYFIMEAYDICDYYQNKIFEIDSTFDYKKVWRFMVTKQFDKAITYIEDDCPENSHMRSALLGENYAQMRNNPKALEHFEALYKQVIIDGPAYDNSIHHYGSYGYALINDGQSEKGLEMLKKQIEIFERVISSNQKINPLVYYQLIPLYFSLGQNEKAYESIHKFEEINGWIISGYATITKFTIGFEVIKENPVFKASLKRGEKQLAEVQKQIRPYLPLTLPTKTD